MGLSTTTTATRAFIVGVITPEIAIIVVIVDKKRSVCGVWSCPQKQQHIATRYCL